MYGGDGGGCVVVEAYAMERNCHFVDVLVQAKVSRSQNINSKLCASSADYVSKCDKGRGCPPGGSVGHYYYRLQSKSLVTVTQNAVPPLHAHRHPRHPPPLMASPLTSPPITPHPGQQGSRHGQIIPHISPPVHHHPHRLSQRPSRKQMGQ